MRLLFLLFFLIPLNSFAQSWAPVTLEFWNQVAGLNYFNGYPSGVNTFTPIPTSTNTFTITPTFTVTNTATNTPTVTPTGTWAPSGITGSFPGANSLGNFLSGSLQSTSVYTPTNSPTNSPTNTVTNTATNTATQTATNTATNTWTSVVIPYNSNLTVNNPSFMPTVGPSNTPIPTVNVSGSNPFNFGPNGIVLSPTATAGSGGGGSGDGPNVILIGSVPGVNEKTPQATVVVTAGVGYVSNYVVAANFNPKVTPSDYIVMSGTPTVVAQSFSYIPYPVSTVTDANDFQFLCPAVTPGFVNSVSIVGYINNLASVGVSYVSTFKSAPNALSVTIGWVNAQSPYYGIEGGAVSMGTGVVSTALSLNATTTTLTATFASPIAASAAGTLGSFYELFCTGMH